LNSKNPVASLERHQNYPYIIRMVPALNLAALKSRPREDNQLLLWYCLRAIDATGRGLLDQEAAINLLSASFRYQRQTVYKHLAKGDCAYWRKLTTRKGQAIITLHSLARVAQRLQADIRAWDRFIELPASELRPSGQVQARRALLYNTATYKSLSAPVNHPISRTSLKEKTGIEPRQQRRYDAVMDTQRPVKQPTFAYYRDQSIFKLRRLVRLVETDRGLVLTHQLPNRYRTWCPGGSKGMLPKVARILTVENQSSMRGEANFATDRHRRYYRSFHAFLKAAARGEAKEGFYPSGASDRKYILETVW